MQTTLLPIEGVAGISSATLNSFQWEMVNDTIFFSGNIRGFLSGSGPNDYYTGEVLIAIQAPVFTWFNGDFGVTGVVNSTYPSLSGNLLSGSGSNKIYLRIVNNDPSVDLLDLSFSGSYTITNS